MQVSEKVAIAAHLHVLLRRKTGRVTDTEWMASNLDYAAEIIRFARASASEDGHADLAEWADKLERVMALPDKLERPLAQRAMQAVRERAAPASMAPRERALSDSQSGSLSVEALPQPSGFSASTFGAESGFMESSFGTDPAKQRERRDPNAPRYVGGIR